MKIKSSILIFLFISLCICNLTVSSNQTNNICTSNKSLYLEKVRTFLLCNQRLTKLKENQEDNTNLNYDIIDYYLKGAFVNLLSNNHFFNQDSELTFLNQLISYSQEPYQNYIIKTLNKNDALDEELVIDKNGLFYNKKEFQGPNPSLGSNCRLTLLNSIFSSQGINLFEKIKNILRKSDINPRSFFFKFINNNDFRFILVKQWCITKEKVILINLSEEKIYKPFTTKQDRNHYLSPNNDFLIEYYIKDDSPNIRKTKKTICFKIFNLKTNEVFEKELEMCNSFKTFQLKNYLFFETSLNSYLLNTETKQVETTGSFKHLKNSSKWLVSTMIPDQVNLFNIETREIKSFQIKEYESTNPYNISHKISPCGNYYYYQKYYVGKNKQSSYTPIQLYNIEHQKNYTLEINKSIFFSKNSKYIAGTTKNNEKINIYLCKDGSLIYSIKINDYLEQKILETNYIQDLIGGKFSQNENIAAFYFNTASNKSKIVLIDINKSKVIKTIDSNNAYNSIKFMFKDLALACKKSKSNTKDLFLFIPKIMNQSET